jgi:predicted acylesterase/phospholipase RssA
LPDHRRTFVRELQAMELQLMQLCASDASWLSPNDESVLRWSLSLARISAVEVMPIEGKPVVVEIGHTTDGYRRQLHACLSPAFAGGRISRDGIRSQVGALERLARAERQSLGQLFSDRLPLAALDRATRRRPLALALGGGGGVGYVYVGAFAALDEAGLVPSLMAGTSMGAVLAAFRARTRALQLGNVRSLLQRLSFRKVFRLFETDARFGLPGPLKLALREVIGHEFRIGDGDDRRFLRLNELEIPTRVCVAGVRSDGSPPDLHPSKRTIEKWFGEGLPTGLFAARKGAASMASALTELLRRPTEAIYLGGDELTRDFDVLDAIGFSAAVPGLIHYDIVRDDPRMIELVTAMMKSRDVQLLVDGGIVDNVPAREAWRAVQAGACIDRDPFVLAMDAFSPRMSAQHLLFLPLMRIAAETAKAGRAAAHVVVDFKHVLSPLAVVPTPSEFIRAIEWGRQELMPLLPMIRKMVGPIPDPPSILAESPSLRGENHELR